ncbi:MAG: DNA-protecting protein DprA [Candidatus Eisenbacteria bacterium]|nr:DNA-protecting protein DprA [Candidatus Eisenbacteria bacterium]
MEEREAALAIACTPGIGPATASELLSVFGSHGAVVDAALGRAASGPLLPAEIASPIAATVASGRHLADLADAARAGARFAVPGDPDYPAVLAEIARAPIGIFVAGAALAGLLPAVAIVGTRAPTPRGVAFARALASDLVRAGLAVVSGLARGIDTAAHRGALDAGGRTVAVLGCGLAAEPYPPENAGLAPEIATSGGAVVSEFSPMQEARPAAFPQRNRIISGLSAGVVVVEAGTRSGALITAARALEQGREVFAVPGPVDEPQSRGPHGLLRRGARLVESVEDVLDELDAAWGPFGRAGAAERARSAGSGAEAGSAPAVGGPAGRVAAALSMTPLSPGEIAVRLGEPVERVLSCLLALELEGLASPAPGGRYVRGRR